MYTSFRRFISFVIVSAILFVLTLSGEAFAAVNVNDSSSFSFTRNMFWSLTLTNIGSATINNNVSSIAGSGGNIINGGDDVENVSLRTGNADAASGIDNTANSTMVNVDADIHTVSGLPDITVDDESSANITESDVQAASIANDNTTTVNNGQAAISTTGSNGIFSGDGIDGALIQTGSATVTGLIVEKLNTINVRFNFRRAAH